MLSFTERLEQIARQNNASAPLRPRPEPAFGVVARWLLENQHRLTRATAKCGRVAEKVEYTVVVGAEHPAIGFVLGGSNNRFKDTVVVYSEPFDVELAPTTRLTSRSLRQKLDDAGYLRCEHRRLTSSIPLRLADLLDPPHGSSRRRGICIEGRLLRDYNKGLFTGR